MNVSLNLFCMGEQGLLPACLSARLRWTNAPWVALMMTGVVILLTLPLEHFDTILGVDMVL